MQQTLFADQYMTCFDATAAYQKAGYKARGASAMAASQRLLATLEVQRYLKAKMERIGSKLDLTAERVLRELARVAFFDPRKVFSGAHLKPMDEWDDDTAAAVAGMEVEALFSGRGDEREQIGNLAKIKIAPKVDALGKLAQHFGLLQRKIELSGPGGTPVGVVVVPEKRIGPPGE